MQKDILGVLLCAALAAPVMAETPRSPSPAPAGKVTDKARDECLGGAFRTCDELAGDAIMGGSRPPADVGRGIEAATFACNAGHGNGCLILAIASCEGWGVPRDPGAAARLAKQACDGGASLACQTGADVCATIRAGFRHDLDAGLATCADTTEGGDVRGVACLAVASAYDSGQPGIPKDPKQADVYYKKACALGAQDPTRGGPPCHDPKP